MAGLSGGPSSILSIKQEIQELKEAGGSGALEVQEGGVPVVNPCTTLNFDGAGVSVTDGGGGLSKISIPGGGGGVGEAFSPFPVAVSTMNIDINSFQNIMYLTIAEADMTCEKITVYGANEGENDGDVECAIYRYVAPGSPSNVLIGLAATDPLDLCDWGPNTLSFVAAEGQNLDVVKGESIMVGMRLKSGTWETVGLDTAFEGWVFGVESSGGLVEFPDSYPELEAEGWQGSPNKFACTIHEDTV